jgi:hypothetical protein
MEVCPPYSATKLLIFLVLIRGVRGQPTIQPTILQLLSRRLVLDRLDADDLHQLGQVLVAVIYHIDIYLLFIDEHVEVLADQLGRPVAGSRVAAARCQHRIGAQPPHNPEAVETGFFGR